MEHEDSTLRLRRPWPTRNVFWNLAAAMIGLGLVIGVTFPFFNVMVGVASQEVLTPRYFAARITAALLIGMANYLIVAAVVRKRLRVLTARLSGAEHTIANNDANDSWQPLADRYALPIDSDDEFGQTTASFNYLMESLDSSRLAERALRHSLVEQANAKLAALATLTAGVAHEMKNPLNFVVNFTEVNLELCKEWSEESPPDSRDLVSNVETNLNLTLHHSQRALGVMAQMLEVGQPRVDEDAQPRHLNRIVADSTKLADQSWRINRSDTRCEVRVELDDDDPTVLCYEGDLVQVVINLVTNGLEAASSATDRHGTVRIKVQHDNESAFIVVTDNGPGIDPQTLPHIFDPFFTTKHGSGGTGLGLSISKAIIDHRYRGELRAAKAPGAGAEFVVRLPLLSVSAKVAAPTPGD